MSAAPGWLRHELLSFVPHGFGARGCQPPPGLVRPVQVHGRTVIEVTGASEAPPGEADSLVCAAPGRSIGVVSADCLPVLLATPSGVVAAAHAGWRGLAAGVLDATVAALARVAPDADRAVAVIGPHIGAGCYEVDEPVVRALSQRFAGVLDGALRRTRPGHFAIELARLAVFDLRRAGLAPQRVALLSDACTACDAERFHSYRRDGPGGGRLFHYITAIQV